MVIQKQVTYWAETSEEDLRVAKLIIEEKGILQGLFFLHLTLEKALKANVCKYAKDYAPHIHNLLSLAKVASISLTDEQADLLSEMNAYNIQGRYPDMISIKPTLEEAREILSEVEVLYEWLINRL